MSVLVMSFLLLDVHAAFFFLRILVPFRLLPLDDLWPTMAPCGATQGTRVACARICAVGTSLLSRNFGHFACH